jgi:hypothetical protein
MGGGDHACFGVCKKERGAIGRQNADDETGRHGNDRVGVRESIARRWPRDFGRGGSVLLVERHHAATELAVVAPKVPSNASAVFKN